MRPWAVLVGPPGAGKTTVGRLLADATGHGFRDTDVDVEQDTGTTIGELFVDRGEAAFRELERAAVARGLEDHDGVLALGGGAVLDAGTRQALRDHTVVFLDVTAAVAAERVGLNRSRPLLLGNPRAQLTRLLAQRRSLYAEVATYVVDTSELEVEQVRDAVLAALVAV